MTSTTNTNIVDALADVLRDGLSDIKNRGEIVNEDVTKDALIYPALVVLGYPPNHRILNTTRQTIFPTFAATLTPYPLSLVLPPF